HPRATRLSTAAHPLVTGRARHTVPLAELRHRPLAAFEVLREPQPLFRRTRLHPGHLLRVNDVPGLLLTMCPGRTLRRLTGCFRAVAPGVLGVPKHLADARLPDLDDRGSPKMFTCDLRIHRPLPCCRLGAGRLLRGATRPSPPAAPL